jgi:hypothetical protein
MNKQCKKGGNEMKNITFSISYDEEKLKALRFFCLQRENMSLENKLQESIDVLYKKVVPVQVREYLESESTNKNYTAVNKEKRGKEIEGNKD